MTRRDFFARVGAAVGAAVVASPVPQLLPRRWFAGAAGMNDAQRDYNLAMSCALESLPTVSRKSPYVPDATSGNWYGDDGDWCAPVKPHSGLDRHLRRGDVLTFKSYYILNRDPEGRR